MCGGNRSDNALEKIIARWAVAAAVAFGLCSAALADRDDRRPDHHRGDTHWHGDNRQFHDRGYSLRYHNYPPRYRDYPRWREGHWYHGPHAGRFGWWWSVDDFWYFYPQPVYPYPEPYSPPIILQEPEDDSDAQEQAPPEPPAAQSWYYCNSAKNYYPYVTSCPEGWQSVPATPPDTSNQ